MYMPSGCSVRLIDLPYKVGAMIAIDGEDDYATIFLNSRLSFEKQWKCLRHELKHLEDDDMFNSKGIIEVESK